MKKLTKTFLTAISAMIIMLSAAAALNVWAQENTDTQTSSSQQAEAESDESSENPSTGYSNAYTKALGIALAALSIGSIVKSYKALGLDEE